MSQVIGLYQGKKCLMVSMDAYVGGAFYQIDDRAFIIMENGAVIDKGEVVGWYDGEAIHRDVTDHEKDFELLKSLVKVGKEHKD